MTKKDDQIRDQLVFVDWLKEQGIYNPMESAGTMQKMHQVWTHCGSPQPTLVRPDIHELIDS